MARFTPDPEAGRRRVEELQGQIAGQVGQLLSSDEWKTWLDTAAKFHKYSFGNQLLILVQKPEADLVAGYGKWQQLGRQVRKGESGIGILAPVTARFATRTPGDDASWRRLGPRERPRFGEEVRTRLVGFKGTTVFDISQTDGDPLPGIRAGRGQLLQGAAPEGLWAKLAGLVEAGGFPVSRGDPGGGANGVTRYGPPREVVVRDDVDDAQAVKTLAHEAGHILLGHGEAEHGLHRGVKEVEAESVAYIVAAAHGLDTSSYTFPYVAAWASRAAAGADGGPLTVTDVVQATGQRVVKVAHKLLDATLPPDPLETSAREEARGFQRSAPAASPTALLDGLPPLALADRQNNAFHAARGAGTRAPGLSAVPGAQSLVEADLGR
jgi:hypothetical protein